MATGNKIIIKYFLVQRANAREAAAVLNDLAALIPPIFGCNDRCFWRLLVETFGRFSDILNAETMDQSS